jgi:hypothetical protein
MSKVRIAEWDKTENYEEKFSVIKKKGKHKRADRDTKKRKIREGSSNIPRQ